MAQAVQTFRVFVSSTFSDLKAERNALQATVFPRLRELCRKNNARFQAIDLRWGVSAEAGLDQQTMAICLDEVARCRRTSPRPNFVVLLGDRYGWRPLPPRIPAADYKEIEARATPEQKALLEKWYPRDENAKPPEHCLQRREGIYATDEGWNPVDRALREIVFPAEAYLHIENFDRSKYGASATEQEILRGALTVKDAPEHVFCFFRSIDDLPADPSAADFTDLDDAGRPDTAARDRLDCDLPGRPPGLKQRLRGKLPRNVRDFRARWNGKPLVPGRPDERITTDHLEELCEAVYGALEGVIKAEIARQKEVPQLDREVEAHEEFGKERTRFFLGRESLLTGIRDYLRREDRAPFAVFGDSGSGKSALMARAARKAQEEFPDARVVVRFIGTTPASSEGRGLLESLCQEISRHYGADVANLPSDYRELSQEFRKRLELAKDHPEHPLFVFLDALDQIPESDPARFLAWIPTTLPEHVHLVVSSLPGERVAVLQHRLPEPNRPRVEPMPREEGGALLKAWLDDARRTLTDGQRAEVLAKFEGSKGLPLYLKLAFEEARRWKSYTPAAETVLEGDIPGVIRGNLFRRLMAKSNHGDLLVRRALGYLAAGKEGLSEGEILQLLSLDGRVFRHFREGARHEVPEGTAKEDRLPVVLWSRLYFDLEPYLAERAAEGGTLLTFYHRQLREVVEEDFLAGRDRGKRHAALARYFAKQPPEFPGGKETVPNLRRLVELPYQQAMGRRWAELFATLTDFPFLERKVASVGVVERKAPDGTVSKTYTGVFALQADYEFALEKMPGATDDEPWQIGRGPIIVTAVDFGKGDGFVVRCYACQTLHPLQQDWLGKKINCPKPGCKGRLRVNPFVAGPPKRAPGPESTPP